jgi:hypothetical protein
MTTCLSPDKNMTSIRFNYLERLRRLRHLELLIIFRLFATDLNVWLRNLTPGRSHCTCGRAGSLNMERRDIEASVVNDGNTKGANAEPE